MTGILILFILSILGITAMLYFKIREMQFGHFVFPLRVRDGLDTYVEDTIDKIHHKSTQLNHVSMGALVARMMRIVTLSSRLIYKTAIQSENKILNFIKGRRTLERQARRSDFLESIEEDKKENGGGEIKE